MTDNLSLKSKITVDCILHTTVSDLKTMLSQLPSLTLLTHGTSLKYKISDESIESTIIFTERRIELSYIFKEVNTTVRRKMLIYLVSIIAFLRESYSINFGSIYPHIIDALSNIKELEFKKPDNSRYMERIAILNNINLKLYHKTAELTNISTTLQKSLADYVSACYKIINSMNYNYDEVEAYLKSTINLAEPFLKTFYGEYKNWCKNEH